MNTSHDQIKAAYRGYLRGRIPESRSACPDPEKLQRFFLAGSSRTSKKKILGHIARCGPCADEFEMFLSIDREAGQFARSLERFYSARCPAESRRLRRGFLPAWEAALIGTGLVFLVLSVLSAIPGLFRPPADGSQVRAPLIPSVRLLRPIGPVPASRDILFQWRIDVPAEYFILELFDEALTLLWKSPPIKSRGFILPAEAAGLIRPGKKFFWQVRVYGRSSPPFESGLKEFSAIRDAR